MISLGFGGEREGGEHGGVFKPHAAHFISLIFLWRTLKSAADIGGGGSETVAARRLQDTEQQV